MTMEPQPHCLDKDVQEERQGYTHTHTQACKKMIQTQTHRLGLYKKTLTHTHNQAHTSRHTNPMRQRQYKGLQYMYYPHTLTPSHI